MAYFVTGDPPVVSTAASASNPSTTTLIAQLDSTQLLTVNRGGTYNVNAYLGGSTQIEWWVEHVLSTGLGSTAIVKRTILRTASAVHSQFQFRIKFETDQFLRVRVGSTFTAIAEATLQAERLE
jgi:hypothetical protein